MGALLLPRPVEGEMASLAERGYPRECCGLLLGEAWEGKTVVVGQHKAQNLASGHDRYEVDPEDYLAAELMAKRSGLAVIGVWHTHPDHPARPSATDRAMAWKGWSYLIVSLDAGAVAEMRSWRLAGDDFVEEEIRHV